MHVVLRLLGLVKTYLNRVVLAVVMMAFGTLLVAAQPKLIQYAVDQVYEGGRWNLLVWVALAILLATVVRSVLNYLERILMEWVAQRVIYDLRNSIYNHLQSLSFSFYDKAQTGQLMSRATADVETLRRFMSFGILRLVSTVLTMLVVLVLLLQMHWRLTIVAMSTMPLLILVVWQFAVKVRPRYRVIQQQMGHITTVLQEAISGVRVVRAFAQEEREIEIGRASCRERL